MPLVVSAFFGAQIRGNGLRSGGLSMSCDAKCAGEFHPEDTFDLVGYTPLSAVEYRGYDRRDVVNDNQAGRIERRLSQLFVARIQTRLE